MMRLVNMATRETGNGKRETKMSAKHSSRQALTHHQEPQERPDSPTYRRRAPCPQSLLQPEDRAPARPASLRRAKSHRRRSRGKTTTQLPPATPPDSGRPTYHRVKYPYRSRRPTHSLPTP